MTSLGLIARMCVYSSSSHSGLRSSGVSRCMVRIPACLGGVS